MVIAYPAAYGMSCLHLVPAFGGSFLLLDGNSEANKEAEDHGRREYRAVAKLLRLELRGCVGLRGAHVKS